VEWVAVLVPVIVALITGPTMFMLRRFDKRNTEQHSQNMDVLKDIHGKVDKIDSRLDSHIEWHAHKE